MITDENVVILAMLVFIGAFLFALGTKVSSLFFFLSGISFIFLALELFSITASVFLSGIIAGLGILIMVLGIFGDLG